MEKKWEVGDWAVFDREIVQVTEIRPSGGATVSNGTTNTSGSSSLLEQLRPLTLRNKYIAETFAWYYKELYGVKGHGGFNFPDISTWFNELVLQVIDNPDRARPYHEVQEFVRLARDYTPVIQGINLFRCWRYHRLR